MSVTQWFRRVKLLLSSTNYHNSGFRIVKFFLFDDFMDDEVNVKFSNAPADFSRSCLNSA